jgi:hypothetical protein
MRRYDAAHRVLENTYRILYHVYTFQSQDGQYAARYTLEGQAIEIKDGVLTTPSTPGEALGWYYIGRAFQDNHMRGKAQYIVAVGMEEMESYFAKLLADYSDYESLAPDRNFFKDNQESIFVKNHLIEISRIYMILLQGPGSENIFPVPFGQHHLSRWMGGDVDQVLERVRLENVDAFGKP